MEAVYIRKIRPNSSYHKFHDCMLVVVQRVIYRVFLWLYTGGSVYVGEYLKVIERGMKCLTAKERATFERKEIGGSFDITLLYKVLQRTCGLAEDTANIWHNPASPTEEESLEHTLYILKEERNSLMHEPQNYIHMSERQLETKLQELRRLCTVVLQKAGERCNRTDQSINTEITRMLKEVDEIKNKPTPSGFTSEKLAALAAFEVRSRPAVLSSCRTFVAPLVRLRRSYRDEVTPLSELLRWRCEDGTVPSVICMSGDTGMGKTSLCQRVFDSWKSADGEVSDLQECDLVIPVRCCDVSTRDLVRQLGNLLEETIASCGPYEFLNLLKTLRILWLVDGFDEATPEAVGLLKSIYKEHGPAHTILVTSRPQDSHTFRKMIPSGEMICDVTLVGLTDAGADTLINKLFQENANSTESWDEAAKDFKLTLRRLGAEVFEERRNPLKLTLFVKLWKKGSLNIKKGGALTQLYAAIQQLHTENLCSKIGVNSNLTRESISRKIEKWVEKLCEVAFDMTLNGQYILVYKPLQKLLEDESDRLLLPSEMCLSTYLMCVLRPAALARGHSSYSFIHGSQQFYLAAQHLYLLLAQSSGGADALHNLIKAKDSDGHTKQLAQLQPVLFHVLATAVAQHKMQQPTAHSTGQLQHIVKVLVQELYRFDSCDWFEVVQYAAYSRLVTREVSDVIPDEWEVVEHTVKAATTLLEFTTPRLINVKILEDIVEAQEILPLLRMIAERRCDVGLFMVTERSHDLFLDVLFGPGGECRLVEFTGNLSAKGCRHLGRMKEILFLRLRIMTQAVLERVMEEVQHLPSLSHLFLNLLMPDISPPEVSGVPSHVRLHIFLPYLNEYDISIAGRAVSTISRKYDKVQASGIKGDEAQRFVEELQNRKVQIKSLERSCEVRTPYFVGRFDISYGPVPLGYPMHRFVTVWDNPPVSFSVRGDQVNVMVKEPLMKPGAGDTR